MNYKNGRKLTPETIAAIRYVTKVGVMSKETWYAHFARGNLRWRQMQWKFLIDSKIFRPHPCTVVSDVVALGSYGQRMVTKHGWKYSVSFHPMEIVHDEKVGIGLWKLEKAGIIKKWMHQKELKRLGLNVFKLQIKRKLHKYPDAIFKREVQGKDQRVALEYDQINQGYFRYLPLLKAYQGKNYIDRIHFVVPSMGAKKSIVRALNKIRDGTLNEKIRFIDLEIWNSSPEEYFRNSGAINVLKAQSSVA